jgi:predicted nuclease of predicted toxin-antitoxin system
VKFKLDENLPAEIAEELQRRGHDADTINDENLSGAPDPEVVAAATADGRVLFTLDKGIANLIQYPKHSGIVLFRPPSAGRKGVAAFVRERLDALLAVDLERRLTVVGQERIRFR